MSTTDITITAGHLATQHGVKLGITEQPLAFLKAVWGVLSAGALVALSAETAYLQAGQWKSTFSMDWTLVSDVREGRYDMTWAAQHNAAEYALPGLGGIYWNGASRKVSVLRRFGARGSLDELEQVGALWCDFDAVKRGYTLEQGLDALLGMPLKPSAIVFSGGGLQAVHLLSEPWQVPNADATREYKAYSIALYRAVFQAHDLVLDPSVHEAARLMRLPGFANRKPERKNALARLVYWNPEARYSIADIKAHAPLPEPKPRPVITLPTKPAGEGLYQVGREFVAHLIEGEQPVERHPMLVKLSMMAARAAIPQGDFLIRVRTIARNWFGDDTRRVEGELDRLVAWAYETVVSDAEAVPLGRYLVQLTGAGFALAPEVIAEQVFDQTVAAPAPEPAAPTYSLADVRAAQQQTIADYLAGIIRGFGTYLLLRTSPGGGKTHAAWFAAMWFARRSLDGGADRGGVAFLGLFKLDENNWRDYVRGFGADPSLCFYLVARNGDPKSAGYCALHQVAETVGRKGWVIKQTLCARCPQRMECEERWYLSQFKAAQTAPVLLGRQQHGMIDEIVAQRKLVIIDESPLNVVAEPSILALEDLTMPPGLAYVQDQYPYEYALLAELVGALAMLLVANPRPGKGERLSEKHITLGGRLVMERLVQTLGENKLDALCGLSMSLVRDAGSTMLHATTPEAVAALPLNFLLSAWEIVRHEYQTYWKPGAKRWNSRIALSGARLRLYPMQPFVFTQNTKVILTDATGDPDLYGKAFAFPKTVSGEYKNLPRLGHVFDPELEPRAKVVQFRGSENTRATVLRKKSQRRPELDIVDAVGNVTAYFEEIDNPAVEQIKRMITRLAEKHHGSLLVVTYKSTAQTLRRWAKDTGALVKDQIVWFGSLRGKNDYKDLEAVIVVGTPRIPSVETLLEAQVWYWDEPLPVDATPALRVAPYPGRSGEGYQYRGYADERVNAMYLHQIQAEIRQCYERIRPNASDSPRYVYLATNFPASDHVDEFHSWASWEIDDCGATYYDAQIGAGKAIFQSDYIAHVCAETGCSWDAAKRSWDRIHGSRAKRPDIETGARKKPKLVQVEEWLKADIKRLEMPVSWSTSQLADQGLEVSTGTVKRALSHARAGSSSALRLNEYIKPSADDDPNGPTDESLEPIRPPPRATKQARVLAWLHEDATRQELSAGAIHKALDMRVGITTIKRALSALKDKSKQKPKRGKKHVRRSTK